MRSVLCLATFTTALWAQTPTPSATPLAVSDSVARAARQLFLENAVCAADLDRVLAIGRKERGGRLDGTTLYRRRMSKEKAASELLKAQKNLAREFSTKFDLSRCGTDIQAARILSRKPIPAPSTAENARDWASVMAEPTVAAILCLRRRTAAGDLEGGTAVSEALEKTYQERFSSFDSARCGTP